MTIVKQTAEGAASRVSRRPAGAALPGASSPSHLRACSPKAQTRSKRPAAHCCPSIKYAVRQKFPSPPPTSPPTHSFLRFGTAPLSRVAQAASCLNSEFGFFSRPSWARKKRMPTRAPQAVMNTRQGLSPLSTSKNQLDAVYTDAVWKRLDAETVWLNCPALSKEGVASQPALQLTTTRAPS